MNQHPSNLGRRGFLGTITGSALAFAFASSQRFAEWLKAEETIAVEKAVLSCLLIDPMLMKAVWRLSFTDFTTTPHATIFFTLTVMHARRNPIDFIALTQCLHAFGALKKCGGAAYITEIFTFVPPAAVSSYYANRLLELSEERGKGVKVRPGVNDRLLGYRSS